MREHIVREYYQEDYSVARETMSHSEAIVILEKIKRGWIPDYNFNGTESDFENYKCHMALNMAIDALSQV